MVDDRTDGDDGVPPETPGAAPEPPPMREVDAWAVISYLLSGVILYGGIGWLLDAWLGTRGLVGVGIVLGAAGGIWLVWLRYSKP
ncbi:MAG: AtpZ/AtpI family protein [Sporichthyaceae bacterium]